MSFFHRAKRRLCWALFSFLPKQPNKVVLQTFYGRGYSDSPAAIAEQLRKRGGYRLFWVVKNQAQASSLPEDVTPVTLDSVLAIYHQCTAGFWVDNARKWAYTQKRGRQFYIQTWHGFPLKRIEKDAADALPPDYVTAAKKDSKLCNLFLSNSQFLSDIYRRSFWYDGEILCRGFPRNDCLVRGDDAAVARARKALGLRPDQKILLYAPTFRKGMDLRVYDVDYAACVEALTTRFGGEWLILAKLHPNIAEKAEELALPPAYVRNASDYPDIQDLYLLSDALLSDYSSVMFDYLVTGKPGFLYVNDLADYRDDRNFYFDLALLPYGQAATNADLCNIILAFEEAAHKKRLADFTAAFGIQESGHAAAAVADWMETRQRSRGTV